MRLLLLLLAVFITFQVSAQVKVRGYYRKDGTYVRPHYRSSPDGNPYNNWSYPGNTNPYTGKTATGNPGTYLKNYNNHSAGSRHSNSTYQASGNAYSGRTSIYRAANASYASTSSAPYGYGNGRLTFWTDSGNGGAVKIYLDGAYVGKLTKYFTKGSPDCGDAGTLSINQPAGTYRLEAKSESRSWSGTVTVTRDRCMIQGLSN